MAFDEKSTQPQLIQRMIGASMLDTNIYEEVENDESATKQAMLVVAIVALATGIGNLGSGGIGGLFIGIAVGIVGWAIWAWITYFVGTKILPTPDTHANWGQLARALGFAQSPGVFMVFGIIPVIGGLVTFLVLIWRLVAMVVAIRQALDYTSTWRAIGVAVLGFIPYAIMTGIVLAILL